MTDPRETDGESHYLRPDPGGTQDPPESTPDSQFAAAVTELVSAAMFSEDVDQLLGHVARLAARVMPAGDTVCGISLDSDPGPRTVASSGGLAMQVDEIQYGLGDGPCLESLRTLRVIYVPDLARETRWRTYPQHAVAYGVRASLSLPLQTADGLHGALNLYAGSPDAFPPAVRETAELFAQQASALLAMVARQARQVQMSDQLRAALASRGVIDQAVGIIMAEQRCTSATAFELLRRASQHRNRRLRDVAADVVRGVSGEEPGLAEFHEPPH